MNRRQNKTQHNSVSGSQSNRHRSRSPQYRKDKDYKQEVRVKQESQTEHNLSEIKKIKSGDVQVKLENDRQETKKPDNVLLSARNRLKTIGIQMKLSNQKPNIAKPKMSVASAFNQDSDEEPEEMPPECRMRMRNIGRDTPTSSGPNSFGKTKQGFSDAKKLFEKNLREAMESALADD